MDNELEQHTNAIEGQLEAHYQAQMEQQVALASAQAEQRYSALMNFKDNWQA